MTSSEHGLEILRNWHTEKTLLWFVALEFSDLTRVNWVSVSLSSDGSGLRVRDEGGTLLRALNIRGAEFREADPAEEPAPFEGFDSKSFARFLFLELEGGEIFVFGEKREPS